MVLRNNRVESAITITLDLSCFPYNKMVPIYVYYLQYLRMNRLVRRTLQTAVRSSSPWSLGALNHVAIAVPDLDEATSFYRDVLKVRDLQKFLSVQKTADRTSL